MKKDILLFGAGKSAHSLVAYLLSICKNKHWFLTVADGDLTAARSKIGDAPEARALGIDITQQQLRHTLIQQADIVISLLPAALHILVAGDCVLFGKNLLTASYIDDSIRALEPEISRKGLLFLCEMGLDPGIDHMSAIKLVHDIDALGGEITSFKSHCGGLVAPESDNNPWHYKVSWNPRNVVMAGAAGAIFMQDGVKRTMGYKELFDECLKVPVAGLGELAAYPNRNSLEYMPVYKLEKAATFIRTTLRYPAFCSAWYAIVSAGLTSDIPFTTDQPASLRSWSKTIHPFVNDGNIAALSYLGLFENEPLPSNGTSPAAVLQYLLETKLMMQPGDRDMIVLLHQIEYVLQGEKFLLESLLVVKGENSRATAMAKTVGLPLGIAAVLILEGKMRLTGLHIPVHSAVYGPVLKQLEEAGIRFSDTLTNLSAG